MVTPVDSRETAAPASAVRIVLTDDHEVVRNGLRMVLLGAQLAAAPPEPDGPPDGLTDRERSTRAELVRYALDHGLVE
jgi:hypothetical protein